MGVEPGQWAPITLAPSETERHLQAQIDELAGAVQVLQRACARQLEQYELLNELRAERVTGQRSD